MQRNLSNTCTQDPFPGSRLCRGLVLVACAGAAVLPFALPAAPEPPDAAPSWTHYDDAAHTFRMDAAGVSYVFGMNNDGELQTLYWGKHLRSTDTVPPVADWPLGQTISYPQAPDHETCNRRPQDHLRRRFPDYRVGAIDEKLQAR